MSTKIKCEKSYPQTRSLYSDQHKSNLIFIYNYDDLIPNQADKTHRWHDRCVSSGA